MVLLMLVAVVGTIAVTWVLNRTFLEDYYLYSKMDMLDEVFQAVRSVVKRAEQENAGQEESEELDSEGFLVDEFGDWNEKETAKGNMQFSDMLKLELDIQAIQNDVSILVAQNSKAVFYSTNSSPDHLGFMLDRLLPSFYPGHKAEFNSYKKIKTVDGVYDLYENYDIRTRTNFIELVWTDAELDTYVLIRTSVESLQANVDIANKFLAYAGILVALLVSVGVFFATKSFIRPVEELSDIAKRMSNLDFDVKYSV